MSDVIPIPGGNQDSCEIPGCNGSLVQIDREIFPHMEGRLQCTRCHHVQTELITTVEQQFNEIIKRNE